MAISTVMTPPAKHLKKSFKMIKKFGNWPGGKRKALKPDLTWNGKRRSFWRLALGRFSKRSWIAKAPQCSTIFSEKAPKIDPKTSQNRAQDAPKSRSGGDTVGNRVSIPNRSPNSPLLGVSWGVLGASWARLGAVLELSWSVLGRLGRILGASGDVLGASWNVLRILH